jgi:DNA-directed RNA polymerase subunit RPC12/RpoP
MAGKRIRCPKCQEVVSIPGHVPVEAVEEVSEPEPVTLAEVSSEAISEVVPTGKRDDFAEVVPTSPRKRSSKECPHCGEMVAVTARRCPACKEELDEDEEDGPNYVPCPRCGSTDVERAIWTFWGSFYFTALFNHVRCQECNHGYNGYSGKSNLLPAIICVTIPALLIAGVIGAVYWVLTERGYF